MWVSVLEGKVTRSKLFFSLSTHCLRESTHIYNQRDWSHIEHNVDSFNIKAIIYVKVYTGLQHGYIYDSLYGFDKYMYIFCTQEIKFINKNLQL